MSTEIRHRRGTAAQHSTFTGAPSEFTHDTTNNAIRVHNGSLVGGNRTLMVSERAQTDGVASLDSSGHVPAVQLGKVMEVVNGSKGVANGIASLDGAGNVPLSQLANVRLPSYATRSLVKAIDSPVLRAPVVLSEEGREGIFVWMAGDFSSQVAADAAEGIYLAPTSDPTGAGGAWVRVVDGPWWAHWFGFSPASTAAANVLAFNALLNLAVLTGAEICIGAGVHRLDAKITKNVSANTFKLRGCGEDVTVLEWTSPDGGLDITVTNIAGFGQLARVVEVSNLSFHTTHASGGTALKGSIQPTIASCVTKVFDFHHNSIRGTDAVADYWDLGIEVVDAWNSHIYNNTVKGLDDATSPFDMDKGISVVRGNDCHVYGNHVYHAAYGIASTTDMPSYGDGCLIHDNRIIGVDYGILSSSTASAVLQGITYNHINAYVCGIALTNTSFTPVTGNLIFKTHVSTRSDWGGIVCGGAGGNFNRITLNQVSTPGAPDGVTNFGVYLSEGTDHIVADNHFVVTSGVFWGVVIASGSKRNKVHDNHADDTVDIAVHFSSPGAPNFVRDNYPSPGFTSFSVNDATPSVGNGSNGRFQTANSALTAVTTLDDMVIGAEVTIHIADIQTSWVHSSGLQLKGNVNVTTGTGAGGFIHFVKRDDGNIFETGRSF